MVGTIVRDVYSYPLPVIVYLQDRHRLFASSRCQLVLNTLFRQHRCSLPGVLHSHLHEGEGWRWCLIPCFVSWTVPGPVSNLTALKITCPALPAVFCNVTLAIASMADHIGNGATLRSRCDATAGWVHSHGHVLALVPSCQYSGSRSQVSHGQGFDIRGLLQLSWNDIRETCDEGQLSESLQSSSLEPRQSRQLPDFVGKYVDTLTSPPNYGQFSLWCKHTVRKCFLKPGLDQADVLLILLLHFHIESQSIPLLVQWQQAGDVIYMLKSGH